MKNKKTFKVVSLLNKKIFNFRLYIYITATLGAIWGFGELRAITLIFFHSKIEATK